ncbi:coiled-coil domain-containing protein 89-like [Paramacrobiotus metropolitanus]|uniref:coiled-coil domain-containing protein 89-like n=1 Tax=Paramacrobiotus metropolitanus TaxID=2943436 RepID=UPI0024464F89|nr:coiled-coil domain-containing protein 89-like [Paramacrobiotus metropolitanus]XP_055339024.1 coiled-coil domain-containing protein 89-like [Paramacrobiotus metropolitanus]
MTDDNGDTITCQGDTETSAKDTEIKRLRQRLHEQSSLIALLSEQAERQAQLIPADFVTERQRADALSQRFDELADKFQELSHIKDSYKEQIRSLELIVRQSAQRQQAALRPLLHAKDEQLDVLKKRIDKLEQDKSGFAAERALFHYEREELHTVLLKKESEISDLSQRLDNTVEKCCHLEAELEKVIGALQENEELRSVVTQRGSLLAGKDKVIAELKEEVLQWRQRLMDAVAKYHEKSSQVDVECRVKALNEEVFQLKKSCSVLERRIEAQKKVTKKTIDQQKSCVERILKASKVGDLLKTYGAAIKYAEN